MVIFIYCIFLLLLFIVYYEMIKRFTWINLMFDRIFGDGNIRL